MGWWWSSDPQSPAAKLSDPTPDAAPTPSQPPASPRHVDKPAAATDAPPAALTREQKADQDLQNIYAEIQAALKQDEALYNQDSGTTATGNSDDSAAAAAAAAAAAVVAADPTLAKYPTTMSCRQAFDAAFYCQSLGGQAMNVYRYGELRECSEHWSDFWFCMRTRSYRDSAKARVIAERYRAKEERYRTGPSSEDVWDQRRPGEELRDPFSKDPDSIEIPGLPPRRKQQQQ